MIDQSLLTAQVMRDFDLLQTKLLLGMTLGLKGASMPIDELVKVTGLAHVMVFSGSNVSLLIRTIRIPFGRFKRLFTLATIGILVSLFILLRPEPSMIRAVIMAILPLLGTYLKRPVHGLHLLIMTALGMLVFDPTLVGNISFQLTFGAVAGIMLFCDTEKEMKNGFSQYIYEVISMTLAAQVFTTPLIFFHFGRISLISPFANLLVSWVISPIMVIGYVYLILHVLSVPIFTVPLIMILKLLINYFIFIVQFMAKIPFAQI